MKRATPWRAAPSAALVGAFALLITTAGTAVAGTSEVVLPPYSDLMQLVDQKLPTQGGAPAPPDTPEGTIDLTPTDPRNSVPAPLDLADGAVGSAQGAAAQDEGEAPEEDTAPLSTSAPAPAQPAWGGLAILAAALLAVGIGIGASIGARARPAPRQRPHARRRERVAPIPEVRVVRQFR